MTTLKLARALASLCLSIALVVLCAVAFGALASAFRYPEQPPRWIMLGLLLAVSWPFTWLARLFPNTQCADTGYDACGADDAAYLGTIIIVLLTYSAIFYSLLSWLSARRRAAPRHEDGAPAKRPGRGEPCDHNGH